jgi:hypothetical protein
VTQNSVESARPPRIGRPFEKGVSGNPGGRPRGLVRRIREQTRDGEELVDYMLAVFRDETASTRDRVAAGTWLADRGFGRPTQTTATLNVPDVPAGRDLRELSDEELKALIAAAS